MAGPIEAREGVILSPVAANAPVSGISRQEELKEVLRLQVERLEPGVFLYCQNDGVTDDAAVQPLFAFGGGITHLNNVGRESHAYLHHILAHWNDLADHTLFSQDLPEPMLKARLLVEPKAWRGTALA